VCFTLPILKKKLLYLDQCAISDMMKSLNPRTDAFQKGRVDPFWRDAFEKIHTLCKLQVLICPDSIMHTEESAMAPYPVPLKRIYELLSHGVSFHDAATIRRFQICEHAQWFADNRNEEYRPSLDPARVMLGEIDGWNDRMLVTINLPEDYGWVDSLRKSRDGASAQLNALFDYWKLGTGKSFDDWYREEVAALGSVVIHHYFTLFAKSFCSTAEDNGIALWDFSSSSTTHLVHALQEIFEKAGSSKEEAHRKTLDYFSSGKHETVPSVRIECMLWAAIARKAVAGQRESPNRGTFSDIRCISSLLPYCDAMFLDREFHNYLREEPLRTRLSNRAQIFSAANKKEFLEYLDELKSQISAEHLALVDEVYGPDWAKPFTDIFIYREME